MEDWQEAIGACRKQVVASRENYQTIQRSLCRLIDSIGRSIAGSKSGEALQTLGKLKDGVYAVWETVLTDKTDQVVLLDAVECLVTSTNLLLNHKQEKSSRRTAGIDDESVSALIRYLDPDRDRNSTGSER